MVLVFPPFRSRAFSLLHEVPALPENGKQAKGFMVTINKIMDGRMKIGEDWNDEYIDWDFPEVRVR
jgi:hypothetical protein